MMTFQKNERSGLFSRILAVTLITVFMVVIPIAYGKTNAMRFSIPVACTLGENCFIQNYFDDDPGPGRQDYACGRLTYDGHKGTDFRLRNYVEMREGIFVLAAADGLVLSTRNNMPDINLDQIDRATIKGREAGNGVVVDHGHGWVTQYSHLRRGSVTVKPGIWVKRGEKLGLIGLSGQTEFPHVDFAVRYKGQKIDPFVGLSGFRNCSSTQESLWTDQALHQLAYQETGWLTAGFSLKAPDAEEARKGLYEHESLKAKAPALVLWVDLLGTLKNDRQSFYIYGPDGKPIFHHATRLKASNVSWFTFAGMKRPNTGWQKGHYQGEYRLSRKGKTIIQLVRTITYRKRQ